MESKDERPNVLSAVKEVVILVNLHFFKNNTYKYVILEILSSIFADVHNAKVK